MHTAFRTSLANGRLIPWGFAALTMLTMVWCWPPMSDLFWFGDEWDLLDELRRHGLWSWVWGFFTESYAPVSKLLWGGTVLLGNGSHAPMMILDWLAHALNVVLFGTLLLRLGFSRSSTALCLAVFGLSTAHIETLGWSILFIQVIAMSFFLGAALWIESRPESLAEWSARDYLILSLLIGCSTFSYIRGVVSGPALFAIIAVAALAVPRSLLGPPVLKAALACLIPAGVAFVLILLLAGGNHQHLGDARSAIFPITQFSALYFALNPLHRLLEFDAWGWRTFMLFFALKVLVISYGFAIASPRQRQFLVGFLVCDVALAVLLGLGRYHTGLPSTTSSRYQYVSMICTLPFAGLCFQAAIQRLRTPAKIRETVAWCAVALVLWTVSSGWRREMNQWVEWRGRPARQVLLHDPAPPENGAVPGVSYMSTTRAKLIIEHFNLH